VEERIADERVRLAAFQWLKAQVSTHGDVLRRTLLARGFDLDGHRVPLVGPQGIFKPRVLARSGAIGDAIRGISIGRSTMTCLSGPGSPGKGKT